MFTRPRPLPTVIDSLKSTSSNWRPRSTPPAPSPSILASNDYSLILQTALSIGRPMPSPILPKIAKNQGIQANVDHIKTPLKHPAFVGTYHFHTHIQIITPSGEVVGVTQLSQEQRLQGSSSIPPLSPGVYQFRIRAYDDGGQLESREPAVRDQGRCRSGITVRSDSVSGGIELGQTAGRPVDQSICRRARSRNGPARPGAGRTARTGRSGRP